MGEHLFQREVRDGTEVLFITPYKLAAPTDGFITRYEILGLKELNIRNRMGRLGDGGRTIDISDVTDIRIVRPSIFKRPWNYGTLIFRASGVPDSDPFSWENIHDPAGVKAFILAIKADNSLPDPDEADLCDDVIFYPHVPKSVDRLLKALKPSKYHAGTYEVRVSKGQWVRAGEVIASYGDIEITAPYDGRVEMVGKATPGLHEWPDLIEPGSSSDNDPYPFDSHTIVFHEDVDAREAYSFALRPLEDAINMDVEGRFWPNKVANAFDRGKVWRDEKRRKGDTFFTIIDLAVFNLKSPGSGLKLPRSLAEDATYCEGLKRYWPLITDARPFTKRVAKVTEVQDADQEFALEERTITEEPYREVEDAADWGEKHDRALDRYGLSRPYTKTELDDRCYELLREAPDGLRPQVRTDYDVLSHFAS